MGSSSREEAFDAKSHSSSWKNREATRLTNGMVELAVLSSGGHLAEFRLVKRNGGESQNVFWEAPWPTFDPGDRAAEDLPPSYGPPEARRFLASYTGHCLCLDYFGGPSVEQAAAGLSLHGEAPNNYWHLLPGAEPDKAKWKVKLPFAQLALEREIRLGMGESVAYVRETVSNEGGAEHAFDWVQHVTFGPPFLTQGESTLSISAQRGLTSPASYDGGSLLANNREFNWPHAPLAGGIGVADLRQPFAEKGFGMIATVQLDPGRKQEYVLAVNWKSRLCIGYFFRRADFPWMTLWEENHSRADTPWNGNTQARGMEFGTTPLPLGREETVRRGPLFDTPHQCVLPAGGKKTAQYLIFLCQIPSGIDSIENVECAGDAIVLYDQSQRQVLSIPAARCADFLA